MHFISYKTNSII